MRLRIVDVGNGKFDVERLHESVTINKVQWIWTASFSEQSEAQRCYPTAERPTQCESCLAILSDTQSSLDCQECCDHEYDSNEGYMCINCGKEGMEDVMSAAHEYAEGDR